MNNILDIEIVGRKKNIWPWSWQTVLILSYLVLVLLFSITINPIEAGHDDRFAHAIVSSVVKAIALCIENGATCLIRVNVPDNKSTLIKCDINYSSVTKVTDFAKYRD